MSPIHREGDGTKKAAPTWERLAERLIREAQERGEFDDLPFQGERIPLDDDSAAGDRALGFHLLRNAGYAPPWIEADKEVRRLLVERDRLHERARRQGELSERTRAELDRLVETTNRAIDALNWLAPTDRVHRRRLDRSVELAALEAAAATLRVEP